MSHRLRAAKGQSLIEMSVVLPTLFLFVGLLLNVLRLGYNALTLQASALQLAREHISPNREPSHSLLDITRIASRLTGRFLAIRLYQHQERLTPWRPFQGVDVVRTVGYTAMSEICTGLPAQRILFWQTPSVPLRFIAISVIEPPVPDER